MALEATKGDDESPRKQVRIHVGLDEKIKEIAASGGYKTRQEAESDILELLNNMDKSDGKGLSETVQEAKAKAEGLTTLHQAIPATDQGMGETKQMMRDKVEMNVLRDMAGTGSQPDSGKMDLQEMMTYNMLNDMSESRRMSNMMMMLAIKNPQGEQGGQGKQDLDIYKAISESNARADERSRQMMEMYEKQRQEDKMAQMEHQHQQELSEKDLQMQQFMAATRESFERLSANVQASYNQVPNDLKSQVAIATESIGALGEMTAQIRGLGIQLGLKPADVDGAIAREKDDWFDKFDRVLGRTKDLVTEVAPMVHDAFMQPGGAPAPGAPPAPGVPAPPDPEAVKAALAGLPKGKYMIVNNQEFKQLTGEDLPPGDELGVLTTEDYNRLKGITVETPTVELVATQPEPTEAVYPVSEERVRKDLDEIRQKVGLDPISFRGGDDSAPVEIPTGPVAETDVPPPPEAPGPEVPETPQVEIPTREVPPPEETPPPEDTSPPPSETPEEEPPPAPPEPPVEEEPPMEGAEAGLEELEQPLPEPETEITEEEQDAVIEEIVKATVVGKAATALQEGTTASEQPGDRVYEEVCKFCGFGCKTPAGRSSHERACPLNPENANKCQYCGRMCASPGGKASHEKACPKNPAKQE